jgi:hypothetical protein
MANINIDLLEEQIENIEDLENIRAQSESEKRKKIFEERKKQEEALARFTATLENKTKDQIEVAQRQFLKEYANLRKLAEVKFEKERFEQEKRNQLNLYKEKAKLSTQEEAKKQKELDKELDFYKRIAELRQTQETGGAAGIAAGKEADRLLKEKKSQEDLKAAFNKTVSALQNISDRLGGEVNSIISTFSKYQSEINTRLQGTALTFQSLQSNLTRNIGTSSFIRTSALLENLNSLVSQGISFNLEQRAFLSTISDKIATTFNVADASLLRIVKLQQQDSSAARLGLEAYLTRYFNNMFQDTQYLQQSFDNVTQALIEATSQMTGQQAVEFEYVVQKWLGSLSAVGASEGTIQGLAQALGYLGSGNVGALSGTAMQNLLVAAASRANLDYASILTDGLNVYNTNALLQAVVGYMQEIGTSGNKVVKSQFAQTFGVSVSDLTAARNLTTQDITSIGSSLMSYTGSIEELTYQLGEVSSRTSVPEIVQNLLANIKYSIGQGIAENPFMAGLFELTNFTRSVTGGIKLPDVMAGGFGVIMNTTLENLIQSGLIGLSTISKLGDVVTGIGKSMNMSSLVNTLGLNNIVTFSRGGGLEDRSSGLSPVESVYVGGASAEDIITSEATNAVINPLGQNNNPPTEGQKTSNDIFNYLVYMLDPKLVSITQLLGASVGYGVNTVEGENKIGTATEYILGYGTSVSVSPSTGTGTTSKIDDISSNVASIYSMLQTGTLNVKVTNVSEFGGV